MKFYSPGLVKHDYKHIIQETLLIVQGSVALEHVCEFSFSFGIPYLVTKS